MIRIRNLWKRFNHLHVLNGLDLDVAKGETIVVLGPSGIGKSVLLKHIIGLLRPDAGTIDVNGYRLNELKTSKLFLAIENMGMLFQGGALFDSLNVEENVGFHLKYHGEPHTQKHLSKREIQEHVDRALEIVGLHGTQKKMPSELSGGMRKRVALARLIAYRPTIILYDEPTTGLDPLIALQINDLIVKTQQELHATSIVVTHDLFCALYVGDRLALMQDGKIVHIADPDTFLHIDHPMIQSFKRTISENPRHVRRRNS